MRFNVFELVDGWEGGDVKEDTNAWILTSGEI
jgi:hypothetical protein